MWIVYQEELERRVVMPYPYPDILGWQAWQFYLVLAMNRRRVWLEWRNVLAK